MPVNNPPSVEVRDEGVSQGRVTALNFTGTGVTATVSGSVATVAVSSGTSGGANVGTAVIDFGAFPGASDASVVVTGQAGILATSVVNAWIRPATSTDHTADEHLVETIRVVAGNIVAGTGFTIYAFNSNQVGEPVLPMPMNNRFVNGATPITFGSSEQSPTAGGAGTRLYGQWNVQWSWA